MMGKTSDVSQGLREFLQQHTTETLPKIQKLITVPSDGDLPTSFATLTENKILSAPVYDVSSKTFIGFLDTRDLLAFCVFASDEKNVTPSLDEVLAVGIKRTTKAIDGVTASYLARRHPFVCLRQGDSLDLVVDVLRRKDVHRVPVVSPDGTLSTIISQSAIVNFLYESRTVLQSLLSTQVGQLDIGTSPVVTVPKCMLASAVFSLMNEKGLSGLGIVDDEGILIANTSASDIKLFLRSKAALNTPIVDFISTIHSLDVDISAPLVCVTKSTPLETVLGKMATVHVHRVFVVDDASKPVSAISVTDLMGLAADVPNP